VNVRYSRKRLALSLQQPTGLWTNGFAYDAARRLTNVVSPAGSHVYTLGGSGPGSPLIKKLLLPNTSYITNTYGAVTGTFLNNSGNTTLDSSTYGYNAANQRTTYVGYTYDKIGQLKIADSSVNTEDRGYAYDSAWNLNYLTNNGVSSTFTVDSRNQLTSTPIGSATNDSNGNLVSYVHHYGSGSTTRICAYDDENRLVSAYSGTVYRTDFGYDGLGRMRTKTTFTWNGSAWVVSATVEYIYDGMRIIQERDGNNLPAVSYTRGTDLSGSLEGAGGIGGLLARSSGYSSGNWTNHNYYHADGNGNIMYLVNNSQTQAAAYRYDPFGNMIGSSGSLATTNVYRFSSKEIHLVDNNGSPPLYYYGYRFYDPSLQRWLNRDPVGEPGGVNLYRFVRNQPTFQTDNYGLYLTSECAAALAALNEFLKEFGNKPNPVLFPQLLRLTANVVTACYHPPPPPPALSPEPITIAIPLQPHPFSCNMGSPTAPQPYTPPCVKAVCSYWPVGCVAGLCIIAPIALPCEGAECMLLLIRAPVLSY
jgi:RHS repeat-associated protein